MYRIQAWDPSNAIALMEYTAKLGFEVGGFEVGNEKEHVLTPADYAGCMKTMSVVFFLLFSFYFPSIFRISFYWPVHFLAPCALVITLTYVKTMSVVFPPPYFLILVRAPSLFRSCHYYATPLVELLLLMGFPEFSSFVG